MIRFIVVFLVTTAVVFTAALPVRGLNHTDLVRVVRMASKPGRVVVLGDSVIAGYSHCDTNTRSIPAMLEKELGEPVVDGSRPGSTVGTSLDALQVAAQARRFRVAVVQVTVNGGLFRSVGPLSHGDRLWSDFVASLTYVSTAAPGRTRFKGREYGGYEENAARYFRKEKAASGCPESAGVDLAFVEYMQWLSYGQPLDVSKGYAQFVARARWLQQHGMATIVVLPPVNYQLIDRLNDHAVMASLRGAVAAADQALQSAAIPSVNLSFTLPSSAFADQWCACGHLNVQGRLEYARRVAESVKPLIESRPN
jgi:hypothetical protein